MPGEAGFVSDWAAASVRLATPLILTAMGGLYAERSGVFNVGMEGMMLAGAFTAVVTSYYTGSTFAGVGAAMIAGVLLALVHSYVSITRRADQILSGVAINLLALGLTNVLYRAVLGGAGRERVAGLLPLRVPGLADIPGLGPVLFEQNAAVYVAYVVPAVAAFVMFRTTWGLHVRAVGESPAAAASAGVSVEAVRHLAILFSGAMAGLGGAALSLGAARYFAQNMTAGRGFIVLGAIAFGKWRPGLVALACLFFGAADALQLRAQTFGFGVPHQFLIMAPYVLTVAAMIGLIGRSRPPQHLGIPYRPEEA